MAYPDTFQRTDGSLGGAWTVVHGAALIVSGQAILTGDTLVICAVASESGAQDHSIVVPTGSGMVGRPGIALKYESSSDNHYWLTISYVSPNYYVQMGSQYGGSDYNYGDASVGPQDGTTLVLRFTYSSGNLTAYVNGVSCITHYEPTYLTQIGFGFKAFSPGAQINAFDSADVAPTSMVVTPDPVWIGGGAVQLTATATGTTWTIGVPGSSVLTCDHGEIVGQYTIDSTHINFTLIPGLWIGAVVFTESEHGMTASIDVTITPPATAPWGLTLSPTAIAYIERSAVAETAPTIANREMVVGGGGGAMSMLDGLADLRSSVDDSTYSPSGSPGANRTAWLIWRILNGVNAPPDMPLVAPSNSTLKQDADSLKASFATLTTSNHWTLGDVITQITGLGVPTIKDVLDELDGLAAPDLSGLSSQLAAIRGDTTTSLATLLSSLAGIRTVDSYSLADVLDAIGDPAQATSPATAVAVLGLVAALALAAPTGGASVAAAAVAVGAGPVLDIATLVELVGVLGELAGIGADVAALAARPSGGYIGAPVWPGASAATLGEAQALSDGLIVTGPLDGLIVAVTGHPAGAGKYAFGSVTSWQHCGAIVFESDRGDYERAESFGLASQLIVPRTMAHAASAVVRLNGGWSGTVRKWSSTT